MPPATVSQNSAPPAALKGRAQPRVWTRPLRPLTREATRGYEVIDFAERIGHPLLPWQRWAVIHALELNPDGTFRFRNVLILVARQNGKSHLARVLTLWRMYLDGAKNILGLAQDVSFAREQWQAVQEMIHECPDLEDEWDRVRNVNGDEHFWAAGCRYSIKALNKKAGRGRSDDLVVIDELRTQTDWGGWAAVSKVTMARRCGQIWCMSNAGDDTSVVLNQIHEAALAERDPSICLMEWSGHPDCELTDTRAIVQANPALGTLISHSAVLSALGTDPPKVFRTEVLCQRVDALDTAIDPAAWKEGADPAGDMSPYRKQIAACFDIAPDEKHCTLVVAAKTLDGKVRLEVAGAWSTTQEARDGLPVLLDKIKPVTTGWFPTGPGAAFATILRKMDNNVELKGALVHEACQGLADLVRTRRLIHSDDPLLNAHIASASKLESGDGWRFARKGGGHVDGAYAAAGAAYAALTQPDVKKSVFRSFSY